MSDQERQQITHDDYNFPPGTVHLVDMNFNLNVQKGDGNIILHPQPSSNVNDPLRWSKTKRNLQFALLWFWSFMLALNMNFMSPLFADWVVEFHTTYFQLGVAIALGYLGLGVGVLFIQPTALKLGKVFVYRLGTILAIVTCIFGSQSSNVGYFHAFRILAGLAASPVDTLVEISANDLFFQHERSTAFSSLILALYGGTDLGPVAAGYIADSMDWSWCYYILIIIFVPMLVLQFFWMEETTFRRSTNEEEELEEEIIAQIKSHETGQLADSPSSKQEDKIDIVVESEPEDDDQVKLTYWQKHKLYHTEHNDPRSWSCIFVRPLYLVTFPAIVWSGMIYGFQMFWLSLTVNTQSAIFSAPPYNFSINNVGLTTLGLFVGSVIGMFYGGPFVDWFAIKMAKRNNGIMEPEHRLHTMLIPTVLNAAGILAYGLGAYYGRHWAISVVLGLGLMGFAMSSSGAICLVYAVECYEKLASESLVLILFIRNMIGMGFSFAISPWIAAQGMMKTTFTMFTLSVVVNATYLLMIWKGKAIRRWSKARYERVSVPSYGDIFKRKK
ncbi:hypothetical protein CORT_0C00770 [Candida orthopsilosis Co 90-125]|uniref:Major facilitator superfamily (MFS) profile domain-containing protein n=1 Tax=Candida orthopsilosis (strain 90-125) TaxID=1136231 RepID=H8X3I1_CANO9|nr:hypothetical protein CORT_0C00770 [Candida orthopsilosis Co 90-125]CCG25454.1 hypothetical protein CORT_0C00770 [Candida orthopsilosis Co 90-125]